MSGRQDELNYRILGLVYEQPGITVAQIIETIFTIVPEGIKPPSKGTIRRRIYRLAEIGSMSLGREPQSILPRKERIA